MIDDSKQKIEATLFSLFKKIDPMLQPKQISVSIDPVSDETKNLMYSRIKSGLPDVELLNAVRMQWVNDGLDAKRITIDLSGVPGLRNATEVIAASFRSSIRRLAIYDPTAQTVSIFVSPSELSEMTGSQKEHFIKTIPASAVRTSV